MNKPTSPLLKLSTLILCLLVTATVSFGQSQATTGNIEGRVTDPNGAAVPGATITATNQDTGLDKSVKTDSEGTYRIIQLRPGKYRVSATLRVLHRRLSRM